MPQYYIYCIIKYAFFNASLISTFWNHKDTNILNNLNKIETIWNNWDNFWELRNTAEQLWQLVIDKSWLSNICANLRWLESAWDNLNKLWPLVKDFQILVTDCTKIWQLVLTCDTLSLTAITFFELWQLLTTCLDL